MSLPLWLVLRELLPSLAGWWGLAMTAPLLALFGPLALPMVLLRVVLSGHLREQGGLEEGDCAVRACSELMCRGLRG